MTHDIESNWCNWMIENFSVNEVMWTIKEYFYANPQDPPNDFKDLFQRQPALVKWLKSKTSFDKASSNLSAEESLYLKIKNTPYSPDLMPWYEDTYNKYNQMAPMFGISPLGAEALRAYKLLCSQQ